ncbi:MAG: cation:proton antiporter [Acidobacteriota bacterium]|nr:cation:proton antiporter [Blastocatellia bacterium]MDW8412602.1 cation:proton antiporter [Acidobacteriota bacterium]
MWQIATIVVMLLLMIGLRLLGISSFSGELRPESTVAAGFLLVCGFTMGELFRRLGLPALLGYIALGILFGPSLVPLAFGSEVTLFSSEVIQDLSLISVPTIGVIGIIGGGELKIADVKNNLKYILAIVAAIFVATTIAIVGLILCMSHLFINNISFLINVSFQEKLAAALIFGILAVGMSPSATIAVIQDLRAKGSLTSLVLGIVVVLDMLLVASFLLSLAIARLLVNAQLELNSIMEVLPKIGSEFGWAILIGVATAFTFVIYLRYIHREKLLFTLLIIFGASYACSLLHAETLLAFLIAGFCVQNFSRHGSNLIHTLETISLPVFVLYFSIQAMSLDLSVLPRYLTLTLAIIATRIIVFTAAIWLAAKWVGLSEAISKNIWMCFYSQGGVDLVLAAMVPPVIPTWGTELQIVTIATVIVYIVMGPPLLKLALDRASETEQARQKAREETAALDQAFSRQRPVVTASQPFYVPTCSDAELSERLSQLRRLFVDLYQEYLVQPSQAYNDKLSNLVHKLDEASKNVFVRLQELLAKQDRIESELERLKVEWRLSIQPEVNQLGLVPALPVSLAMIKKILAQVHSAVQFDLVIKVKLEEELFRRGPDDRLLRRFLKGLRRLRQACLGTSSRSVYLGKLWCYYVELSLARYLASAAATTSRQNILFWYNLGLHIRKVDRGLDELVKLAGENPSLLAEAVQKQAKDNEARLRQIREQLALATSSRLEKYSWGLHQVFKEFIQGVSKCGTLELPSFNYRPSTRIDAARRAEEHLRTILSREEKIVTGYRGWLYLDQQLALFNSKYREYQNKVLRLLEENLGDCGNDFELLARQLTTASQKCLPSEEFRTHWIESLVESIKPTLELTRKRIEQGTVLFRESATRELFELLAGIVDRFSESLTVTLQDPDVEPPNNSSIETLNLPIRRWFETKLVRDIAIRLAEFSERTEVLLQRASVDLNRVQSILDFNLIVLEREADELALLEKQMLNALRRAAKIAEQSAEHIKSQTSELSRWMRKEMAQILSRASYPFEAHKIQEVQREFPARAERVQEVAKATLSLYRQYFPLVAEFVETARRKVTDSQPCMRRDEFLSKARDLHLLPRTYRRLFLPLPLDIADFYVQRPAIEAELAAAINGWAAGQAVSILVYGERGTGKRTVVQHLLHQNQQVLQIGSHLEECTLRLDDLTCSEEDVCRQMAALRGEGLVGSFEAFTSLVRADESKRVYVVENAEKLYERSERGMKLCKAFLKMVSATSNRVLWIVLLRRPAVTLLQSSLCLYDYFTHKVEVEAFDFEALVQLIQKRHSVSGFELEYSLPRVQRWIGKAEQPQQLFFERLYQVSKGIPLLAMIYWLNSIHTVSEDEMLLRVELPPEEPLVLIDDLSLNKRLLLSYLLQHSSLTAPQAARLLGWNSEQVETEVEHLMRLGLVERISATMNSYRVRAFFEPLLAMELRRQNFC